MAIGVHGKTHTPMARADDLDGHQHVISAGIQRGATDESTGRAEARRLRQTDGPDRLPNPGLQIAPLLKAGEGVGFIPK